MLLEGLHIPLTTPFHPDGRLNPHKLAANIARYSKTPAAGLILLAPHAGEPTLLTDDETHEALRAAVEAATPEKVLLANVSRDSVRATLALAEFAASLACDAILIEVPSILASTSQPSQLLTYFRALADASPLPLVLFSSVARAIPASAILELAVHPNILGLIDQSSDAARIAGIVRATSAVRRDATVTSTFAAVTARMQREAAAKAAQSTISTLVPATSLARNPAAAATAVAEPPAASSLLRTRTRSVGFQILATTPVALLDALRSGGTGIAPSFAACAPQATYEVFAAWKDDDQPLAEEKQHRLQAAANFTEGQGPGTLKHGCDLNGYFGGLPRLPHLPLNAEQRAQLQQLMSGMRT